MIKNRAVLVVFRVVLGVLFVYAGAVKALDPLDFAQNIRNYRLVGQELSFLAPSSCPGSRSWPGPFLSPGSGRAARP
jgi:hypothetical protein